MTVNIVKYLKKVRSLSINLIGWCALIFLWYQFMFHQIGLYKTVNAMQMIALWAIILFIFCFLWNRLNLDNKFFHSDAASKFIRNNAKDWSWSEVTLDQNDNIIDSKERLLLICKQKENILSSSRKHSYSAILIKDGNIKEALGFLRQILNDPYIGQLARKIAESELNLIFLEDNLLNRIKECSIMSESNDHEEKKIPLSFIGYNKKQMDEYLNELMAYNWNLEKENKELKSDLENYNRNTQRNNTNISYAKWEEREYSFLLGLTLQEDLLDYKGNVICEKNTIITSQLIESLISKGLYGELVSAADSSKGVERNAH